MKMTKTLCSFVAAIVVCGTFFVGCNPVNTPPQPEPVEEGFLKYMPSMVYWEKNDLHDLSKPIIALCYDPTAGVGNGNPGPLYLFVRYYSGYGITAVNVIYEHEQTEDNCFLLTESEVRGVSEDSGSYYDDWVKIRDRYIASTWVFTSEYRAGDGIYWRLSDESGEMADLVFSETGEW